MSEWREGEGGTNLLHLEVGESEVFAEVLGKILGSDERIEQVPHQHIGYQQPVHLVGQHDRNQLLFWIVFIVSKTTRIERTSER